MAGHNENPEATPQDSRDRSALTHRRLLGGRLYIQTWGRLLVAVAIGVAALSDRYLHLLDPGTNVVLGVVAVVLAAYNAGAWFLFRRFRSPRRSAVANQMLQRTMFATIVLDYLNLSVILWLTGGARSPFIPFYLVHVVLGHLLLSGRRAASAAGFAFVLLTGLVVGEFSGWLTTHTPFGSVEALPERTLGFSCTIVAVYGALFALTSLFMIDLTGKLREREVRLHSANAEQQRLSNMRKDFLRIAMHNLRAPVGAVTMLLRNMHTGLGGHLTDKQEEWVLRSLRRLDGLLAFLHDLQMLSMLDNQALRAQHDEIDLGPMLESLVREYQDLAEARKHVLVLDVPAELPRVRGIERLLREAVVNFITNAIKYTPEGGCICVRAGRHGSGLRIAVEDDGPGIAPADQQRLFNEFVRVGRTEAQTGSGLGLFIVKRVAEAHGGSAKVESKEGAGSTFTLDLPLTNAKADAGAG